jgi:hypothetical protein
MSVLAAAVELVAAGLAAVVAVVVVAGDFAVAGEVAVAGDFVVAAEGELFAEPCAKPSDAGTDANRAIVRMSLMRFIMERSFLF